MGPRMLVQLFKDYPLGLLLGIDKSVNRMYRAVFISSLLAQPFAKRMAQGPAALAAIANDLNVPDDSAELKAWLEFGVSIKVLSRKGDQYAIKNKLARRLVEDQGTWSAFYRLRAEVFSTYVLQTPQKLAKGERFELDDAHGELYAWSSRTVEPTLTRFTRDLIPASGTCRLLEVGCGSGIYIKIACQVNPELRVVGIEMQHSTAELARKNAGEWGLSDRVTILEDDVRQHMDDEKYDLITMHNLIYYFPEKERQALLEHMHSLLKPGGRLVLSTLCLSKLPSIQALNLWSCMNQGCGPLPRHKDLIDLFNQAGFMEVESQELMPEMWCCSGRS